MLGEIKEVTGLSKMPRERERKKHSSDCFIDEHADFKYPNNAANFDDLLEIFQKKRAPCNENYLRENIKLDAYCYGRALLTDQKHLQIFSLFHENLV